MRSPMRAHAGGGLGRPADALDTGTELAAAICICRGRPHFRSSPGIVRHYPSATTRDTASPHCCRVRLFPRASPLDFCWQPERACPSICNPSSPRSRTTKPGPTISSCFGRPPRAERNLAAELPAKTREVWDQCRLQHAACLRGRTDNIAEDPSVSVVPGTSAVAGNQSFGRCVAGVRARAMRRGVSVDGSHSRR